MAIFGHLIFIVLHILALCSLGAGLVITIPLHIIFAVLVSMANKPQIIQMIGADGRPTTQTVQAKNGGGKMFVAMGVLGFGVVIGVVFVIVAALSLARGAAANMTPPASTPAVSTPATTAQASTSAASQTDQAGSVNLPDEVHPTTDVATPTIAAAPPAMPVETMRVADTETIAEVAKELGTILDSFKPAVRQPFEQSIGGRVQAAMLRRIDAATAKLDGVSDSTGTIEPMRSAAANLRAAVEAWKLTDVDAAPLQTTFADADATMRKKAGTIRMGQAAARDAEEREAARLAEIERQMKEPITDWKIGAVGSISIRVIQIVDEQTILGAVNVQRNIMLQGVNTGGVTDGERVTYNSMKIIDTATYTTQFGARATVLLAVPFDPHSGTDQ